MEKSAQNEPVRFPENQTTSAAGATSAKGRGVADTAKGATLAKGAGAASTATTALRIWQHSRVVALPDLEEELQDRILILRNHPDVCAMSHNQGLISYAAHLDYLRELRRPQSGRDCCVLFCNAIRLLKQPPEQASVSDASSSLKPLRPIIGVVSVDHRIADRPLLGLYKNLYHYPHIKLGRALLFAAMLRASGLGLREVFLECYGHNLAMQKLARQFGFLPERSESGEWLSFQRYLPSTQKLLQEPIFSDFAQLHREELSLNRKSAKPGQRI